MKKYLFVAASAALVLSSCSNEITESFKTSETQNLNERKALSVSAYTKGQTRSEEATIDELQRDGFYLNINNYDADAAQGTSVQTIVNTTYSYDASNKAWSAYTGDVYWPLDASEKIVYTAYYSAAEANRELRPVNDDHTIELKSMDYSGVDDLLVAHGETSLQTNGETLNLQFSHIGAQIKVNLFTDPNYKKEDGYLYFVKAVYIQIPAGKGVYDAKTGNFAYTIESDYDSSRIQYGSDGSVSAGSDCPDADMGDVYGAGVTGVDLRNYDEDGIVIAMVGVDEDNEVVPLKLIVDYVVNTGNSYHVGSLTSATAEIYPSAGYCNTYNVTLSPLFKKLTVDASVTNWLEDSDNVTLP